MQTGKLTIIILVHNNQKYLNRLLPYYANVENIDILIADSSEKPYKEVSKAQLIKYYYIPEKTLTNKLTKALNLVQTEFVSLLGADDFIIPETAFLCLDFLKKNEDYSCAIGSDVFFIQKKDEIIFIPVYDRCHKSITNENDRERLLKFFNNYRTIYCAVHYTKNLKAVYDMALNNVSYLYLNEFLTCVLPIYVGKVKFLNEVYTVREYNETSDGFVSTQLFSIIDSDITSYNNFLGINVNIVAEYMKKDHSEVKKELDSIFQNFADYLRQICRPKNPDFVKRVGNLIAHIPIIGKNIVEKRRTAAMKKKMNKIFCNNHDRKNLIAVRDAIK